MTIIMNMNKKLKKLTFSKNQPTKETNSNLLPMF